VPAPYHASGFPLTVKVPRYLCSGRGGPIAYILRLAGVDFQYETFGLADFANPDSDYHTRKNAGEFSTFAVSGGGLPIYKEGGKTYFETNAIMRMLGARYGYYSADPETMWEIDVCMEKVEQVFNHAGIAQHSHYCLANNGAAADPPQGDGPTEEQTAACFAMYDDLATWGEAQLTKHGKTFLAGTDNPTIADFRYIVQFGDSVYNDEESSVLGSVMKERVKAVISTKPAFKKWIEETMAGVLKDVRSNDLMW
jgi:glutathione S-transferase